MTTVLYVEDEGLLAKIIKETLESNGFDIILAKDGIEGLRKYKENDFDICILDIMLPKKNGYDLASDIRKIDPTIPIIFLTAKLQTKDLLKGFEVGGNDYLKKPFSIEELIARVHNLLSITPRKVKIQDKFVLNDDVHYSPKNMEVRVNTSMFKLSHKENEILKMLVKNKNIIVDRKSLLHQVWGDDSYYNSRTLDVYISKLRNIFKEEERITIQTLKGVGYKFLVG